jgi:hypothetical protein
LFDRIEVGAVGRQEDEVSAFGADGIAGCFAFMAAEIVEDDNVALGQGRSENLLDIDGEGSPLMGPSMIQGAQIRLWRSAATKVMVFQ